MPSASACGSAASQVRRALAHGRRRRRSRETVRARHGRPHRRCTCPRRSRRRARCTSSCGPAGDPARWRPPSGTRSASSTPTCRSTACGRWASGSSRRWRGSGSRCCCSRCSRARARAGDDRHLRRHGLSGQPGHARDRDPHGARRDAVRHSRSRAEAGHGGGRRSGVAIGLAGPSR